MSKKSFVKNYLQENVNMDAFKTEYQASWVFQKPFDWIYSNGIVHQYFCKLSKEAVKLAGYKHPDSDRTCITVLDVQREIIYEHKQFLLS